jgi:hypothetical protein
VEYSIKKLDKIEIIENKWTIEHAECAHHPEAELLVGGLDALKKRVLFRPQHGSGQKLMKGVEKNWVSHSYRVFTLDPHIQRDSVSRYRQLDQIPPRTY